jgi:hypothetical protein
VDARPAPYLDLELVCGVPYKQYYEVFIHTFATALYGTVSPLTSYCTTMNLLLRSLTHGQGTRIPPQVACGGR